MSSFLSQFSTLSLPHFGMVKLPQVNISIEQKRLYKVADNASNKDFLLALARAGSERLEHRIPTDKRQIYGNRAKTELAIFDELGFTDYVLLVWLVINKARELGVFIDYGRGSCAGSIIFWFLGITGVDPIDKQLLFERFVSRVRSKKQIIDGEIYLQGDLIADADLNLGNGRDEIVQWLHEQYPDAVSKIVTHGTLTGKVLINNVYKCYSNASDAEAHQISGMLEMKFGVVDDIEDTYKKSDQFKAWADEHKDVYDICLRLRNLILQTGVHASGYVISPQPFDGFLPIQLSKNKEIISCYAMEDVCNFTIKLDLLGLVTNRIIREVLEKTGEDLDAINLDSDPLIYDRFQDGKLLPYGLYQISADCAYGAVMAIKPKNIAELSDSGSIARPGAVAYLDGYIQNNHSCPHPLFASILGRTRNFCLDGDTKLFNIADSKFYKIKDIKSVDKFVIQTINEETYESEAKSVSQLYSLGEKEVSELILDNGYKITTTLDHKIFTQRGWIVLGDLTNDDFVACCPKLLHGGNNNSVSRDRLQILAYLLADGYLGKYCADNFVNKDLIIIDAYCQAVAREFPKLVERSFTQIRDVVRISHSQKIPSTRIPNDLCAWLREIGLKPNKQQSTTSAKKFIPEFVFGLNKEYIAFFVSCLWDCDGHCGKTMWMYKTISRRMAYDISNLLLILGLPNAIYRTTYINKRGGQEAFQVTIFDTKAAKEGFGRMFVSIKNQDAPGYCRSEIAIPKEKIIPSNFFLELHGLKKLSIQIGLSSGYLGHLKQTKGDRKIQKTSFDKLSLLGNLSGGNKYYNVRWSKVKRIKAIGKKAVFDITVEDNHNFFANNILVHNCLYQEQLMQMAVAVGFTLDEAEILRKIVGKKLVEKAKEWKQKIYDRVKQSGLEINIADILWKILEDSASYSFNASHSYATSYLTALTVYLKYKHPQAFMCACLNATKDMPDEIEQRALIIQELPRLGVEILPPDLLKSGPMFQLEGSAAIRYALSGIKGVSEISMKKLGNFRLVGQFASKLEMLDAAKTAGLDMRILGGLILSGCLNWVNTPRTKFLLESQLYNLLSDVQKTKVKQFIHETDGDLIETLRLLTTKVNEKGKALIPESQMNTLRRNYTPYFELYQHNSKNEELASYMHEMHYLGYSFSSTLFKIYSRKVVGLVEVSDILKRGKAHAERVAKLTKGEKAPWVDPIVFVTHVSEAKVMFSQKDGTPYLKLMLADDSGTIRALLYGAERVEACKRANEGELPKEGQVVICEGGFAKDGSMIFAESVIVQPDPIKLRRTTTKDVEI